MGTYRDSTTPRAPALRGIPTVGGSVPLAMGLILLLGIAIGIVSLTARGWAGEPRAAAAPASIRFSLQQIQAFMAETAPHVERIMGRKFKHLPPLVIDDTEAVAAILAGDIEPNVRKANPDLNQQEVANLALTQARDQMPEILGKYGLKAKKLGVLPANLVPMLVEHRIELKHATGIMKLLIAHELAHALQAQYLDVFGILNSQPTEDATAACTAVIEGQAMFVQEQVARALRLEDAAAANNKVIALDAEEADALHSPDVAIYQEFIYLTGRRFTEHHYAKGGADRLWEILAKPPATTAMISHPDTYSPVAPKSPDLAKAMAIATRDFRKSRWAMNEHELGEIHLRAVYAATEKTALDRLADNFVAGRVLGIRSAERGGDFQLVLLVLRDPQAAPGLIDRLAAEVLHEFKAVRQEGAYRIRENRDGKFSEIKGDASRHLALVLADEQGREAYAKQVILISRGPVLVHLSALNYVVSKGKLTKVLESVLASAEQAAGQGK